MGKLRGAKKEETIVEETSRDGSILRVLIYMFGTVS